MGHYYNIIPLIARPSRILVSVTCAWYIMVRFNIVMDKSVGFKVTMFIYTTFQNIERSSFSSPKNDKISN